MRPSPLAKPNSPLATSLCEVKRRCPLAQTNSPLATSLGEVKRHCPLAQTNSPLATSLWEVKRHSPLATFPCKQTTRRVYHHRTSTTARKSMGRTKLAIAPRINVAGSKSKRNRSQCRTGRTTQVIFPSQRQLQSDQLTEAACVLRDWRYTTQLPQHCCNTLHRAVQQ